MLPEVCGWARKHNAVLPCVLEQASTVLWPTPWDVQLPGATVLWGSLLWALPVVVLESLLAPRHYSPEGTGLRNIPDPRHPVTTSLCLFPPRPRTSYFKDKPSLPMQSPARSVPWRWTTESCGGKGMVQPLSQEESTPILSLTGFYCISGHITLRMVLIYCAQFRFRWLLFTEYKGEGVVNYIKKEGYLQMQR